MKPGYKTTEFWLSLLVVVLGALLSSGALPDGSIVARAVGGVLAVAGSLGYTLARAREKVTRVAAGAISDGIGTSPNENP